jgi:dTDP-4-amino-4,6-dideoxygalactose transaminase
MKKIKLSKSFVGEEEKKALGRVIDETYLGMGKHVQEFEEKLKGYLGCPYVICVNSGTAALHLAIMAAGLQSGDEVLVQSMTFIASFQAISATGAKPVPCELKPESFTIDLDDAGKRLTERTKAIMPVHYAGRVGDLDRVYEFAARHKLRIIEDAAHAFGTCYKGKKIGSFGDIVCFSFDGIKNITSGEGGVVVTSDEKIAQYVKDGRLLGIEKDTEERYAGQRSWEFNVAHQGYRYHLSNIFAAIGMVQLKRFENEFRPMRQKLAKRYTEMLKDERGIILFSDDYDEITPHIFVIRILDRKRDKVRANLLNNSIECGIHYLPNHILTYYGGGKTSLPITERIYGEILSIPLHPEISFEDQDFIVQKIKEALK